MSKKRPANNLKQNKNSQQDSVVKEAWENMNADMQKVLPDFLAKRLQKKEGKLGFMIILTVIELLVLGVVGKFVYDWLVG